MSDSFRLYKRHPKPAKNQIMTHIGQSEWLYQVGMKTLIENRQRNSQITYLSEYHLHKRFTIAYVNENLHLYE